MMTISIIQPWAWRIITGRIGRIMALLDLIEEGDRA